MIASMTAFGRIRQTIDGLNITAEIKSVNGRYLDCNCRLPKPWAYLEEKIKPFLLEAGVTRGKIDLYVSCEDLRAATAVLSLDKAYAGQYVAALRQLRDEFGLPDDITTMSVAANQDVFSVAAPEEDPDRDGQTLTKAVSAVLEVFLRSREDEGGRLKADILKKLEGIGSRVEQIAKKSESDITGYREKLADRVRQALQDNKISIDESRILTECAIYADRVAIDEELVRLRSHIEAFTAICDDPSPAGKRLDFLLQEMNREVNTIGSKCSDAEIAHMVVDIKNELEKIREQVQNIE